MTCEPSKQFILIVMILIALLDLSSTKGYGAAVRGECIGIFYDKKAGRKVWSHETFEKLEIGGLIGIKLRNEAIYDGICNCTKKLIDQFPPKSNNNIFIAWSFATRPNALPKPLTVGIIS